MNKQVFYKGYEVQCYADGYFVTMGAQITWTNRSLKDAKAQIDRLLAK